jgi:hypothetical protein
MGPLSHIFPYLSATSERDGDAGTGATGTADRRAGSRTPTRALWSSWRFTAIESEISFEAWCDAPHAQKELAYAVHRDALRREHAAAVLLAERCAVSDSLAV